MGTTGSQIFRWEQPLIEPGTKILNGFKQVLKYSDGSSGFPTSLAFGSKWVAGEPDK